MDQPSLHKGHLRAILLALFVTFLWSTSWVLVKIGLKSNLPSITFAGLRYTLAFLCLIPFAAFHLPHRTTIRNLSKRTWAELILLGVLFYALTQGAQFVSLSFLPAATLNLILNFSPVVVALFGSFGRRETASLGQWAGILISTAGALIYFLPQAVPAAQLTGIVAGLVALLANSGSSVFGRYMNSQGRLPPIIVTSISMGIGGIIMLMVGIFTQGWGTLDFSNSLIIGWLALVNTALAFTLWNRTLQTLTAVESSVLNGMMLPQIAILAWIFLGEALTIRQIIGIALVGIGTMVVQLWKYLPSRKI
ncbi:MAG: DMT family transporter [Chloroflexota bacterium]